MLELCALWVFVSLVFLVLYIHFFSALKKRNINQALRLIEEWKKNAGNAAKRTEIEAALMGVLPPTIRSINIAGRQYQRTSEEIGELHFDSLSELKEYLLSSPPSEFELP